MKRRSSAELALFQEGGLHVPRVGLSFISLMMNPSEPLLKLKLQNFAVRSSGESNLGVTLMDEKKLLTVGEEPSSLWACSIEEQVEAYRQLVAKLLQIDFASWTLWLSWMNLCGEFRRMKAKAPSPNCSSTSSG
ncbi:hypothetical protein KSP39_PZI015937 [Platanthera zijinensis]|uniref:Uncharacterized protein n=1 Tax=Platanthera zijinensis TaxID=2320716 RepID=A0AAP0B9H6_9ASPA